MANPILDGTTDFSSIPKRAFLNIGAIVLFGQFIVYQASQNRSFQLNLLDFAVLMLISASAISAAGAHNGYLSQQKLAHLLACFLTYLAIRFTCSNWSNINLAAVFTAISVTMTVVAAIGVLQHIQIEPTFLYVLFPSGSTFGDMPFAVEYLVMFLPFAIVSFARSNSIVTGAIHWTAATLSIIYSIHTGCRAGWVSMSVIFAYLFASLFMNRKFVPGLGKVKIPLVFLHAS